MEPSQGCSLPPPGLGTWAGHCAVCAPERSCSSSSADDSPWLSECWPDPGALGGESGHGIGVCVCEDGFCLVTQPHGPPTSTSGPRLRTAPQPQPPSPSSRLSWSSCCSAAGSPRGPGGTWQGGEIRQAWSLAWVSLVGAILGLRRGEWGGRLTRCPAPGGFVVPEKAATARWAPARGGWRPREPRGSLPSAESSLGPWQGQEVRGAMGHGAASVVTPGTEGSGLRSLSWGTLGRPLAGLLGACGGDELGLPGAICTHSPLPRPSMGSGCREGAGEVGAGSLGQPLPGLGTDFGGNSEQEPSPASEATATGDLGSGLACPSSAGLWGHAWPTSGQAAGCTSGPLSPGAFLAPWGADSRPPAP